MKGAVCSIVMLCLTGYVFGAGVKEACNDQTTCDADLSCHDSVCKANAGSSCTASSTDECITGATCESEKCTCPADTHMASGDKSACLLKLGQACSDKNECYVHTDHGVCNTTCGCAEGYTMSEDKTKCSANSGPRTAVGSILFVLVTAIMSRLM